MSDSPAPVPTTPALSESKNKLNTGLRYAATSAATALAFLGAVSILSVDQITEVKQQIEILNQSILTGWGALTKMWVILGPIALVVLARVGINSSTVPALAAKLLSIASNRADPQSTQAKAVLLNAAASPAIGTSGIVNREMAADPATASNVVANSSLIPKPIA